MNLKYLVAPIISGAIFLSGCATQNYQNKPKKQEENWDQYFVETREQILERREKERRFRDALTETDKADKYSAAHIACGAISLREGVNGTYLVLKKRYEACMRAQLK